MIPVVFDAHVVIAACGGSAEPYACVVLVARRRARSFVTDEMVGEWRTTLDKPEAKGVKFRRSPWPPLEWLIQVSQRVKSAPLGKPRSRDAKDDPYLACALSAGVRFIISRDPDERAIPRPPPRSIRMA